MKSSEFCYWLKGFFELRDGNAGTSDELSDNQSKVIQRHLAMVFKHELDATHGDAEHQAELQAIHDGKLKVGGVGPDGKVYRC